MPSSATADTDPADITDWACDKSMWYINYRDGTRGELLWQGEKEENVSAVETLAIADRTLLYACIEAAVLAVIAGLAAWTVKNPKGKRFFTVLSAAAAAYALFSVLISAGQLICYSGYRPQLDYTVIFAVLLAAAALCGRKLFQMNRLDKII